MIRAKDLELLNQLLVDALLDPAVARQLVNERDISLFETWGLSDEVISWLLIVSFNSVDELARKIIAEIEINGRSPKSSW